MTQLSLEKKWLQKGLTHPGGMIPLLTEKGEPVDSKLIEKAFLNGWIELLPSARDGACFVGCRLTRSGRDFLDKGASAVESPVAKSPVSPQEGSKQEESKQGVSKSAALLLEMLQSSKSRLAASVAERQLPPSRTMSMVFLLSLIPAVGLSIYMLYPSQPERIATSETGPETSAKSGVETGAGEEATQTAAAPLEQTAPSVQPAASPAGTPVAGQEGYWQNIVSLMMNDRAAQQDGGSMPAQEGPPETSGAAPAEGQAEEKAAPAEEMADATEDAPPSSGEESKVLASVALPPEKPEIAPSAVPPPAAESTPETETQIALTLPEPAAAEAPDLPPEAPAAPAAAPGTVPEAPPAPSENRVMEVETPPELPVVELPAPEIPAAESPSVAAAAAELPGTELPAFPAQSEEEEPAQASPQPEEQPVEPPMEMASQEPEPAPSAISVLETEPAALAATDSTEAGPEAEGEAIGETGFAQNEAEAPAIADAPLEGGEEAQAVAAQEPAANSEETIQLAESALEDPTEPAEPADAAERPEPSALEREPLAAAQPEVSPGAGSEAVVATATLEAPAAQEENAPEAQPTPAGEAVGAAVLTIDREQPRSEGLPTEPESAAAASSDGSIERAAAPSVTDWTLDRSTPALEENRQAAAESSDEMSASDEAAAANAGSSALRQVQLAILPPLKPTPPETLPATTLASVPEAATAEAAPGTGLPRAGYTVQFVSLDSEEAAQKAASALTAELSTLLGPRSLYVIKAQVSGKTYYRVRVKAEMTQEEAGTLCQESKSSGQDCFVSRNEA